MWKHQLFSIILCRHYQENTSQLVLSQRTKLQQIRKSIKHKTSSIYGDLNVAISIQRGRSEVKNLLPRLEAKMPLLSELLETWTKFLLVIVQVNKSMRKHILLLCFCTTEINKSSSGVRYLSWTSTSGEVKTQMKSQDFTQPIRITKIAGLGWQQLSHHFNDSREASFTEARRSWLYGTRQPQDTQCCRELGLEDVQILPVPPVSTSLHCPSLPTHEFSKKKWEISIWEIQA